MGIQTTFQRYETKYILTAAQKAALLRAMKPHMQLDEYGRTTIRNLYYDSDSFRLARRSMEKPPYKEKLRVRSYGSAGEQDRVFVELKKKYDGIVYKRRMTLPLQQARDWLDGTQNAPKETQIAAEIEYFRDYYGTLAPRCHLSYEREAYYCVDRSDLRITMDENIFGRFDSFSLSGSPLGTRILPAENTLLEVKCAGGYPFWLLDFLQREHVRKTSFSKYGKAYAMHQGEQGEMAASEILHLKRA